MPRPIPVARPAFLLQAAVLAGVDSRGLPTGQRSTLEHHPRSDRPGHGSGRPAQRADRQVLLRKEVIQPHLPVRLPCYDFVPIADPTFDGSLSCELGHRLRVLPTFVT